MTDRCTSESIAGYRCESQAGHKNLHRAHGITFGSRFVHEVKPDHLDELGDDFDWIGELLHQLENGSSMPMPRHMWKIHEKAQEQRKREKASADGNEPVEMTQVQWKEERDGLRARLVALYGTIDRALPGSENIPTDGTPELRLTSLIKAFEEMTQACEDKHRLVGDLKHERLEVMRLCVDRLEPRLCSDSVVQRVTALCARITAMGEECDELRADLKGNADVVGAALGLGGYTTFSQRVERAKALVVELAKLKDESLIGALLLERDKLNEKLSKATMQRSSERDKLSAGYNALAQAVEAARKVLDTARGDRQ